VTTLFLCISLASPVLREFIWDRAIFQSCFVNLENCLGMFHRNLRVLRNDRESVFRGIGFVLARVVVRMVGKNNEVKGVES